MDGGNSKKAHWPFRCTLLIPDKSIFMSQVPTPKPLYSSVYFVGDWVTVPSDRGTTAGLHPGMFYMLDTRDQETSIKAG